MDCSVIHKALHKLVYSVQNGIGNGDGDSLVRGSNRSLRKPQDPVSPHEESPPGTKQEHLTFPHFLYLIYPKKLMFIAES